jgi:hypothetical protein
VELALNSTADDNITPKLVAHDSMVVELAPDSMEVELVTDSVTYGD